MNYSKQQQTKSRKKKKSKQTTERRQLIKSLDTEVRRIIAKRDDLCFVCGELKESLGLFSKENYNGFQVLHYIKRRVYALRWDLKNCAGGCGTCNGRHRFNELPHTRAMAEKYGSGIFREFEEIRKTTLKTTDMRRLLSQLKLL